MPQRCKGVWLEIAKSGAPAATVGYAEAVEIALCYGWIDGHKKKPETRATRIETIVAMLARGEKIHPKSTLRPGGPS